MLDLGVKQSSLKKISRMKCLCLLNCSPLSCIRNFKTQDGPMIDGGQSQRWLEDEVPSKKPRVSNTLRNCLQKAE